MRRDKGEAHLRAKWRGLPPGLMVEKSGQRIIAPSFQRYGNNQGNTLRSILYYIILHYVTLHYIILYYIILYHTILYYIILLYYACNMTTPQAPRRPWTPLLGVQTRWGAGQGDLLGCSQAHLLCLLLSVCLLF